MVRGRLVHAGGTGQGDRADEIDPPDKTPAIVANARELDAALADGLCREEG